MRVLARTDESRYVDAVEVAHEVDAPKELLLCGDLLAVLVGGRHGAGRFDAEDPPAARHALELVCALLGEREPRSGDQILHRARDQDLIRARQAHDARADVDRDARDTGLDHIELAGVQPSTHLDPELMGPLDD